MINTPEDGDYLRRIPLGLLRAFHAQAVAEAKRPGLHQAVMTAARNRLAAELANRGEQPTHRGRNP